MKHIYRFFFILLIALAIHSCGKRQKSIVIYGSSKCHHCVHFLEQLDSARMQYDFRDFMDAEKKYDEEMLKKLDEYGYRGYIRLPVVEVNGKFFVKAEFNEVYDEAFSE